MSPRKFGTLALVATASKRNTAFLDVFELRRAAWAVPLLPPVAAAKKYQELICWQVAATLRDRILKLTENWPASRPKKFCDDIQCSARSAPSNLAEGFGAVYPREFARMARIARRSLIETRNHLEDAREQKYFKGEEIKELIHLTFRSQKATTRLIKYLERCKGKLPEEWDLQQ
jgi:four helix bundle protein